MEAGPAATAGCRRCWLRCTNGVVSWRSRIHAAEPPRIVRSLEWPTMPTPPCTEFFTPLSHEAFKMHAVIQVLEETPIGSFSALFLQEWIWHEDQNFFSGNKRKRKTTTTTTYRNEILSERRDLCKCSELIARFKMTNLNRALRETPPSLPQCFSLTKLYYTIKLQQHDLGFRGWTLNPGLHRMNQAPYGQQKFNRNLASTQSTNCPLRFFPGSHSKSLTHMQRLLQHCKKAQLASTLKLWLCFSL